MTFAKRKQPEPGRGINDRSSLHSRNLFQPLGGHDVVAGLDSRTANEGKVGVGCRFYPNDVHILWSALGLDQNFPSRNLPFTGNEAFLNGAIVKDKLHGGA